MKTQDLTNYLDQYLRTQEIPDTSLNGLQVQGAKKVTKIGYAVDACLDSIKAAAAEKVNYLIVHHGLFWGHEQTITNSHHKRIEALIKNNINLYCSHLPLDIHPEVGNNAVLATKLSLAVEYYFGEFRGTPIAVHARSKSKLTAEKLGERLRKVLGDHVRVDAFGPKEFKTVGICTGAGASFFPEAKKIGISAFITGEPRHSFYHFSKEENMHACYGRHYDTETLGLHALADHLAEISGIPHTFFDFPSDI